MEGKVKFFNETKGFGFIKESQSGKEYFVHITGVNGGDTLNQDDDVYARDFLISGFFVILAL